MIYDISKLHNTDLAVFIVKAVMLTEEKGMQTPPVVDIKLIVDGEEISFEDFSNSVVRGVNQNVTKRAGELLEERFTTLEVTLSEFRDRLVDIITEKVC